MTKQALIERTIGALNKLPQEKAEEVLDFVLILLKRHEERAISEGLRHLANTSTALAFLHDEKDVYSLADLKQVYHGQG